MSEYAKELKEVQLEIKDLLKIETELKKKKREGLLDDDEEIELEGVTELLATLEKYKKFWQELVYQENKPKEMYNSFGEAGQSLIINSRNNAGNTAKKMES
jgi:hypothetical protein